MSFSSDRQNLKFLLIPYRTLKNMGINLNTLERKDLLNNYWNFIILITCTLYLEYALLNFAAYNVANLHVATGALSVFNQGCLILLKITIFLKNGDKFIKLIWDMNQLAGKASHMEYKKWLEENSRSKLIVKFYFYACWIAVGCAGVIPLIYMAYYYLQTNEFIGKLPFGGRFPFDNGGLMAFSLNYVFSVLFIYSLLNMTVGIDGLYGWFIYNISAHFRILRYKVSSMALKLDEEHQTFNDFTRNIDSIVCYHNKTLKFVRQLNDIFGGILWAEVMLSSLQMCFIIYTLNNETDFSTIPFNFMALVVISMQLMIYCFGGEKIKNEVGRFRKS